jgi:dUTP pyrophosphatase
MEVKIKRIDKSLPLPAYESIGAAGFDLLARLETTVLPGQIALVPTNIVVEIPKSHMLQIVSRGSTPRKKGLLPPHGIGIIDSDYRGNGDEIMIQVYNFTSDTVIIDRGEKIAQGIFVPVDLASWDEVSDMTSNTRGGFGSTDKN